MIFPEELYQDPIEKIPKKIFYPKPLRKIAVENIKLDDKQLNNELARKMIYAYYSTDRVLQVRFSFTLDSHQISHANSELTMRPNYIELGSEAIFIRQVLKEMVTIHGRLIYQYKFKYQTVFSAKVDQLAEDTQVLDETELYVSLNINQKLAESDTGIIDIKSQLDHQTHKQKTTDCGWRFNEICSMKLILQN